MDKIQELIDKKTIEIKALYIRANEIDEQIERLQQERDEVYEKIGGARAERTSLTHTKSMLDKEV